MAGKTMKMLVIALIAAFTLTASMAEAAATKKTRHRAKHSSRVSSGARATTGTKPAAKKKATTAKGAHAKANGATHAAAVKKAPAKRRPTTKPR